MWLPTHMEFLKLTTLVFALNEWFPSTVGMGLCDFEEKFPCEDKEGVVCFKNPGCKRQSPKKFTTQTPLCPPNMVYANCNTCQSTCMDPESCINNCTEPETCVCGDGFLLKGVDCVLEEQCGCFIQEEGVIPEGEFYVNTNCSRLGDCNNGQLIWNDSYMCNSDEVCDERNDVRKCYGTNADCLDVFLDGFTESGIYTILPTNWPGSPFQVYCNMTDGGGWTTFQRRIDGTVDFYQNWTSYKEGFGSLDHEEWLGNEKLYYLTNQKRYTIRIDFVNVDGSPYYAKYDYFRINDENDNYRLSQLGSYNGTADERGSSHPKAGHSLTYHLNYQFSTYDRDNDLLDSGNCAESSYGAWWYKNCKYSNLNGRYDVSSCTSDDIRWNNLPGGRCIKYVEMKIRPF